MRKKTFLNYYSFLILLLIVSTLYPSISYALSGVPSILSYQGRLTDSSGTLLGGSSGTTYYFKFSIWDNPTVDLGNRLWPVSAPTATSTIVKSGVFNINIGDSGYPDPLTYNFNTNQTIYLQVEVSSDNSTFETLSPRQQITSAPFARLANAVSGTDVSSFGTTTPVENVAVTIEATSTSAIPLLLRAALNQAADLFRIQDNAGINLFSINSSGGIFASSTLTVGTSTTLFIVDAEGNVGVGTQAPTRKFSVLHASSNAQLRLAQSSSLFGEFHLDPSGDLLLSSNSGSGGHIRMQDENLWVCSGGSCDPNVTVSGEGNVIVETSIVFDNNFKLQQINASTTRMLDTTNAVILEFDESDQ